MSLKIKITYVDFHWDNYQGGSGKSFEMKTIIEVPGSMEAGKVLGFVYEKTAEHAKAARPFRQEERQGETSPFTITKIEIF